MSAVLRITASEAREGDELLVGPQGPIRGNPTISAIEDRHGALIVTLVFDGPSYASAAWLPDSPLTVYRPNAIPEAMQHALGELGEALMKDGAAKDACIGRAISILNGTVRP